MIESDADRLAYLQAFGVRARADRGELLGVFDASYVNAEGVDESTPVIECRSIDVAKLQITRGGTLVVDETTYTVRRLEPDGTGMTRLILGR